MKSRCSHVDPADRIVDALLVHDPDDGLQCLARDVARLCNRDVASVRFVALRRHEEPTTVSPRDESPQLALDLARR